MRDQTARNPKFPVACARCGGRISEPIAFCPHCGAHARFALGGTPAPAESTQHIGGARSAPQGRSATAHGSAAAPPDDFEGDLDLPWPGRPTPLFASPDGDPYADVHSPAFRGGARQWGFKGGTALVVAAFVVLYGGAVAIHRYDGASPVSQPNASKSVEGAIASNGGADASVPPAASTEPPAQAVARAGNDVAPTRSSMSNDARVSPSPSASVAANDAPLSPQASPQAGAPGAVRAPNAAIASIPAPGVTAQMPPSPAQEPAPAAPADRQQAVDTGSARAPVRGTDTAANTPARQASHSRPQRDPATAQTGRASASYALNSAQAQLSKSDLRGARASLARVLSADPHNGEALALRDQLLSREQARDASLSEAHSCVVQSRWNCVWHNAGKALSIDASSTEAKALVDRAIVESGAATAPAGPGPDNVEVPMVQ